MLSLPRAWVQSLVGELSSHKLSGHDQKTNKQTNCKTKQNKSDIKQLEILTLYKIKELLIFGLHRDILIIVFKIFQGCMLKYFVMK